MANGALAHPPLGAACILDEGVAGVRTAVTGLGDAAQKHGTLPQSGWTVSNDPSGHEHSKGSGISATG